VLVFAVAVVASLENDIANDGNDKEDDADCSGGDARASLGEVDQAASHDDEQMRGCFLVLEPWSLSMVVLRSYNLDPGDTAESLHQYISVTDRTATEQCSGVRLSCRCVPLSWGWIRILSKEG
jgi:hypothetical protein